uniref:Lysosomal membrane ascorbate-dependent ferrireductase CYB561A3 n=2 Tax=Dromaius novaehollandiae TaxID=8790 RepID=A0A8C4KN15_DRONO
MPRAGLRHCPAGAGMLELPFLPFCALLGGLGAVCVAFVSAWCQRWRGGFAWDGSAQMFNWHPVLMVTGMVVLYGAGEQGGAGRAGCGARRPHLTSCPHSGPGVPPALLLEWPQVPLEGAARRPGPGGLRPRRPGAGGRLQLPQRPRDAQHVLASQLAGPGHCAALLLPGGCCASPCQAPAPAPPPLTPGHPSLQWLAGFVSFLLPWAPAWLRALYKPVHVFFGSTILTLAMVSCVSGINEKLFFSLKNGTTAYSQLPSEAVFANTLGLLILLFGVLVLWALARPDWKRPEPDSVDAHQPLLSAER